MRRMKIKDLLFFGKLKVTPNRNNRSKIKASKIGKLRVSLDYIKSIRF